MAESHTDSLLTPTEVANNWDVSLRTVHRYIATGRLKAIRLPGGHYRIRPEDAEAAVTVLEPAPAMDVAAVREIVRQEIEAAS